MFDSPAYFLFLIPVVLLYWPLNHRTQTFSSFLREIAWHSFGRKYATWLKGSGEDVKTTQELMRHANSGLTLDVHPQALTSAKPAAHLKLKMVEMIRRAMETTSIPLFPR